MRVKDYEHHFVPFKTSLDRVDSLKNKLWKLSMYSASTGLHLAICYTFLKRLGIDEPWVDEKIRDLLEFRGERLE